MKNEQLVQMLQKNWGLDPSSAQRRGGGTQVPEFVWWISDPIAKPKCFSGTLDIFDGLFIQKHCYVGRPSVDEINKCSLWLWQTVRNGKSSLLIATSSINGSFSAMLVITRWYMYKGRWDGICVDFLTDWRRGREDRSAGHDESGPGP